MGIETDYSISDIEKLFSISERQIRYYIKDGILKGNKINGKWLFTYEQIMNFTSCSEYAYIMRRKATKMIFDFIHKLEFRDENDEAFMMYRMGIDGSEPIIKKLITAVLNDYLKCVIIQEKSSITVCLQGKRIDLRLFMN